MIQLYSQRPDAIDAPCFRTRPIQFDKEEMILPARSVTIAPQRVTVVSDADAEYILERFGRSGIVKVEQNELATTPEEALEDAQRRAKKLRYEHLVNNIRAYQQMVGREQAVGSSPSLPRPELYAQVRELKALQAEVIASDPVLSAVLPEAGPVEIPNLIADELKAFGVQSGGVTPRALTDLPT